jgi:nucleotide-binding universal stress UspA family protein
MKTKRATSRSRLSQRAKSKHETSELLGYSIPAVRPSLAIKKILVPIDFSKHSLKAARYAARFAEQFGARIYLLYVLEKPTYVRGKKGVARAIPLNELAKRAESKLYSLANEEIVELVPVNAQVRIGKPFDQIVKHAKSKQMDLIIIATHGYTGLKHVQLGSTAERVVRHAPCPVLVVRMAEREFV